MFNNFKITVPVPTEDLKEQKLVSITCKPVVKTDSYGLPTSIKFQVKIPDIIYNNLLDYDKHFKSREKAVADQRKRLGYDTSLMEKYFKKTITESTVEKIIEILSNYTSKINVINSREEKRKVKKIFIRFNGSHHHTKCSWTGGYTGILTNTSFQFFIGYEIMEPIDHFYPNGDVRPEYYTLIRYSTGSLAHLDTGFEEGVEFHPLYERSKRNEFLNTYKIINYSKERHEFLKHLQEQFIKLNADLNEYTKDLNDTNINTLINSTKLLLTNDTSK